MHTNFICVATLSLLSVFASSMQSASVAAQEGTDSVDGPDAPVGNPLTHNAELLNELLQRSVEQTTRETKFAAAANLTGGAILIGLGTWRLVEKDPGNQFSRGLGVMFMTMGAASLTLGIYAATRIPHEQRRLDRWERARKDGIGEIELAHFEGELQASREHSEGVRLLVRWDGFAHALAGIVVLALTPIADSTGRADRAAGYVIGSLFVATGFGTFGNSFRPTPSEKAWRDYNARKTPMPGHELSWGVAPSVSRHGAGLSVGGTF